MKRNKKQSEIRLYGLLYLDETELSSENVSTRNFSDKVSVYLNCATTLSNSLRARGITFTLITNKVKLLRRLIPCTLDSLKIIEIPFNTKVPLGIRFYSAHYKLDVYRYLSSPKFSYVGLCDLDMICINNYPISFLNNIKQRIPMYYDISDQVIPAYGNSIIVQDLESIHHIESEGRWAGGEFISGTPKFFSILIKQIDSIYSNYLANINKLHHVGDEALTSAALEMIRKKGIYVADTGTLGIVGRFWSIKVLHPQKPFNYFTQSFLLHLPSDKRFLADIARKKIIETSTIIKNYNRYRMVKKIKSIIPITIFGTNQ